MPGKIFSALPKKSRSLFHYTTAQGLLGICKTQSLHATHSSFLNDSTECTIVNSFLIKILAADYARQVPKLIEMKLIDAGVLQEFGRQFFAQEAEKSINAMLTAVNNTSPYFVTSFCIHDEGDPAYFDGLLSQWRS